MSPNMVLEAPPGAGKTTRVPAALLSLGPGQVWVLEPRRLAARLAARWVAAERGERLGETVGYQVRFEEVAGPRTRLRFLTEGVFTRKLLSDPTLRGVSVVVLDEFHERHLEGDLALALLRRLQQTERPDLRLVVMSATMDAAPVARHLGSCPILRSEGKLFDLRVDYSPVSPRPLEEQVAAAVETLQRDGLDGDVLVFLPGAAEIRRAARACEPLAQRAGLLLTPLHGSLAPAEQDRALLRANRPKVILSTNVAESSVTIEGVTAVIDSGLARIAGHSPWNGLPTLQVARVSKASATQRAGRAARTRPGRVIRLYPAQDFERRHALEAPEVTRLELSQMCLHLKAMGVDDPSELPWLDPPPAEALRAASGLLARLGATGAKGKLTDTGRKMARLPLHPRLARLVVEAERRGVAEEGCAVAALLSVGKRLPDESHHAGPSDLLFLLDQPWSAQAQKTWRQILRAANIRGGQEPRHAAEHDQALLIAILTAFPDRVAKRTRVAVEEPGGKGSRAAGRGSAKTVQRLLLASGGGAALSAASVVRQSDLLVAADIEERREHGVPLVRLASAIEPEWLLDLYPERLRERRGVEWNRAAERVEAVSALLYDELVVEETRSGAVEPEAAANLLAAKALEAGVERFVAAEELEGFLARVDFAAEHSALPRLGEDDVRAALVSLCLGRRSFAELRAATQDGGFLAALATRLDPQHARLLEQLAPARISLPGRRGVKVHYAEGKPPWVASRLQDFFGVKQTPRLAGGKVPLVVHLLAPNNRPVQMTSDLEGFWQRLYPEIRRQLSRRYPKHKWPENP